MSIAADGDMGENARSRNVDGDMGENARSRDADGGGDACSSDGNAAARSAHTGDAFHAENIPSEGVVSEATLRQLERLCERFGAQPARSPLMARQLVKRAGQLARERDWSEARALEHLLRLMIEASGPGGGPQGPQ